LDQNHESRLVVMSLSELLSDYWPIIAFLVAISASMLVFRIETKKDIQSIDQKVLKMDSDISAALRIIAENRQADWLRMEDIRRLDSDKSDRRNDVVDGKMDGMKDLITQVLLETAKNKEAK